MSWRPSIRLLALRCQSGPIRACPTPVSVNIRLLPNQFSTSTACLKKSRSKHRDNEPANLPEGAAVSSPANEAFDFTNLENKVLKALEHLTHQLSELRSGARFNTDALERLHVQLKTGESLLIKDLAQVVIKGRFVNVILSDEEHIKPVRSAIQGSNLSLTPQGPVPETPTTLTITIPPVTGESRQQAVAEANQIAQKSIEEIQHARAEKHKKLRAMLKSRSVVPDDVHAAEKKMQEVVDRGKTEVKKILDGARRVMEGR